MTDFLRSFKTALQHPARLLRKQSLRIAFILLPALLPLTGSAQLLATAPLATAPLANGVTSERTLLFSALSGQKTTQLRGGISKAVVDFGIRHDEIVTRARLRLRYTYSPALIPQQSHIKLSMNGELIGIVPVLQEERGKKLVFDTEIDPRLLTDFNKLGLEFIAHYQVECEDPLHSSLWADINGTSELILTVQKITAANDLAILPEPFFDRRDSSKVDVNFIFGATPSRGTLQAAALTASWFGKLATYRGTHFTTSLNAIPPGHGVVFTTDSERPTMLAKMAPGTGPALSVVTNPSDGISKLLIISGRNSEDLARAAEALSVGNVAMSGSNVAIKKIMSAPPRPAYDAPSWVRLDRPMRFAELAESTQSFQVAGHQPPPILINLRIPPDLFTWRSKGIPLELRYRYSAIARTGESRLTMRINDELVQAVNLPQTSLPGEATRLRLPILANDTIQNSESVLIPAFKLGIRNTLQYGFSFTYEKEGACREYVPDNIAAMIDADSKIDFTGLPNFTEMPNLGFFATSGYPFTRYADLAQTVVVLPQNPSRLDMQTLFALMARMGESTGAVASRVRLANPQDEALLKDADLLLIGTATTQTLLQKWSDQLPATIVGNVKRISQTRRPLSFLYNWFNFGVNNKPEITSQENVAGDGAIGMLLGFESPVTAKRSVVAVTATSDEVMGNVVDTLNDTGRNQLIHGSAVFIRGQQVDSTLAGGTYTIGSLPFWLLIWFNMSEHPIWLALAVLFVVLICGFALWRSLRAVARKREDRNA